MTAGKLQRVTYITPAGELLIKILGSQSSAIHLSLKCQNVLFHVTVLLLHLVHFGLYLCRRRLHALSLLDLLLLL